jgi:hypothetical protein
MLGVCQGLGQSKGKGGGQLRAEIGEVVHGRLQGTKVFFFVAQSANGRA